MKQTIKLLVAISAINLAIVSVVAMTAVAPPSRPSAQQSATNGFSLEELSQLESPSKSPSVTPPNPNPVLTSTPTPTATPQEVVDNRCLITIDGAKYDMTQFRNTHSGGDIFACGADMSGDFWGQHGQKELNKLAQYRI